MDSRDVYAPTAPTGALPVADGVEAFLGSGGVAGLLFTASWCAAGVLLERQFKETASTSRVPLVVVDCESHPHLADRFQVRSLPTFVLMRAEREEGRLLGAFSLDQVRSLLERPALVRTAAKTVASTKTTGRSAPAPTASPTVSPVPSDSTLPGGPS
jgi:thioredoxin-like negative regulator of GroEL